MKHLTIIVLLTLLTFPEVKAQRVLTLEECRQLAVDNNGTLEQERVRQQMAGYDKKIAAANYFPNISVQGGYLHNGDNINLISSEQSAMLTNMGTAAQQAINGGITTLVQNIMSNPQAAAQYASNAALWQTIIGTLSTADVATSLNALGTQLDNALHFNIENVGGGAVSLQQPLFAGGKIVASNKIAVLAEQLAQYRYDEARDNVIIEVDKSYWQVISIAAKKALADDYSNLLKKMLADAGEAVNEGVATEADLLSVKVKANEAAMLQTRSENGLKLAKMLLCKQIGLPLDSDIELADEGVEKFMAPQLQEARTLDEICSVRPEMKELELAGKIYEKKVAVTRADMLPKIALTANYLYTNPNVKDGFRNEWSGTWNAGVIVKIPIFHGTEALQKTRKAKAEASLYKLKYEESRKLVDLQVNQLRCQFDEANQRMAMAESNLRSAEENLRSATLGFEEGVVPANTAMAAQTAWLQAHGEMIDSQIELQIIVMNLKKAEGERL